MAKTVRPGAVVAAPRQPRFGILQARMAAFDDQAAQTRARLAGEVHRHPAPQRVADQPVVKYVVTIKRSLQQNIDPGKVLHCDIRGAAVARQIEIQPRPGAKRVADFPPLVAVAGKTVQKDQPGITRLAMFDSRAEGHRRLTCASSCWRVCVPSVSLTASSITVAPALRQAPASASSSVCQSAGR